VSWHPGPPQVVFRHLLAEAIREALTTREPIGDTAISYNVVEAITRLAESVDRLAAALDRFRVGEDSDDP
jgi:hypothetical protein